jgi:hypothetical protein
VIALTWNVLHRSRSPLIDRVSVSLPTVTEKRDPCQGWNSLKRQSRTHHRAQSSSDDLRGPSYLNVELVSLMLRVENSVIWLSLGTSGRFLLAQAYLWLNAILLEVLYIVFTFLFVILYSPRDRILQEPDSSPYPAMIQHHVIIGKRLSLEAKEDPRRSRRLLMRSSSCCYRSQQGSSLSRDGWEP